ncbi:MAG: AmmeMemoRadiSam system radical SAM enzyme [Deltaproteobacteria bacterium]|nr:AmmeMemoRadiSam system radical SAM enzyme [Deltaproteobacteria bacterium]
MRAAVLYERLPRDRVRCHLCAHRCRLRDRQLGVCGVRENRGGVLLSLVYGRAIAVHVDPVEKKPLFHFQPGSRTLSIATVGCNFRCRHCQNWEISQYGHLHRGEQLPGDDLPPEAVVAMARGSGARSISYTYTEPTVFMEYAFDTATLARREGLRNVFVTNGYMTPEAVDLIAPVLDAANVDIKGLRDEVMKRELKASHAPVLASVRRLKERGVWVEATTLVVPRSNDSDDELRGIAEFVASVDRDLPWHLSAFHPDYQTLDRPRTPRRTLDRAMEIGRRAGLRHVYAGNVWDADGESTVCPGCGTIVIERRGFSLGRVRLAAGRCASCRAAIAGVDLP